MDKIDERRRDVKEGIICLCDDCTLTINAGEDLYRILCGTYVKTLCIHCMQIVQNNARRELVARGSHAN